MLINETSISKQFVPFIGNIEAEASGRLLKWPESDEHLSVWQISGFSKVSVEWINVFGNSSNSDCLEYVSEQSQQEYCEMFPNWG